MDFKTTAYVPLRLPSGDGRHWVAIAFCAGDEWCPNRRTALNRAVHQSPVTVAFTRLISDLNDEYSPLRKIQSKAKMAIRAIAKKTIPPW
jgi:hypothetical protein